MSCYMSDTTSAAAAAARAVLCWVTQGDFRGKRFSICQCTRGTDLPIAQVERESHFASSTTFLE
jgi:hypothetical protein